MRGSRPTAKHRLARSGRSVPVVLATVGALVLTTMTAVAGVAGIGVITAPAASAASSLVCDQNTIYGIDANGNMDAINATTGAATLVKSVSPAFNGLGITNNGIASYAFDGTDRKLTKYDPSTGAVTTFNSGDSLAPTSIIRGAVDPLTGIYYYGGGGVSAYVGAFNTSTNTPIGQVGTITGLTTGNGDFAFSSRGLLFVVASNEVRRVDDTTPPSTAGNQTLTTTLVATLPGTTNSPGIAFSSDGYLFVSNGATLIKLDPASGAQIGATITISGGFTPTDLASCNYPNTLSVQKNVVGRVNPTDEFGLSVTGGGITTGNTATTTGANTGVQAEVAGASLVTPAKTYTIAETAAGGANLANYTSTYSCTNVNNNAAIASGSTASGTFVFPAAVSAAGTDVICTFTNTPKTAPLTLTKTLGGSRSDGSDQFTVAVRSGSATGPILNSTTNSTTTGTGAAVTAGTGTTGATPVVVANQYFLTESLAAGSKSIASQYTATVTCTDANGVQTGLPAGAAFAGSLAITPVVGSAITCTVTNNPVPPTLLVNTVLDTPRYANTDQFTEAIRTGGTAGTVVNSTTNSQTAGTAQTVTAGTGTTGTYTATTAATYTVTDGFTANPTKYTTTVTCVDAKGLQPNLPTGALFTGSLDITIVAGAAITCTLHQSVIPESLSLTKTGPASMTVGAVTSYTFVVTNTSQVTIGNLVITDPKAGTVTCPVTTLGAGASTTCSAASYTVTAADVSTGAVSNTATAGATLPGCTGDRASATCPVLTSNLSSTRTPTIVLASTGVDVRLHLELGALAVLFGLGLVLLGRRRRRVS